MIPKLSVYVSSLEEIKRAYSFNIHRYIIEHPFISARYQHRWMRETSFDEWKQIEDLYQYISLLPPINGDLAEVYLLIDIIPRSIHESLLNDCLLYCKALGIRNFYIQDISLILDIKRIIPDAIIVLQMEKSNANIESQKFYANNSIKKIDRQVFSNEISFESMAYSAKTVDTEFEVMLHGMILLHHTPRKIFEDLTLDEQKKNDSPELPTLSPQGWPVMQNQHGVHIFNSHDLCNIPYLDQFMNAGIFNFMLDLRGFSSEYKHVCLSVYQEEIMQAYAVFLDSTRSKWLLSDKSLEKLEKIKDRPLSSPFFKENISDVGIKFKQRQFERFRIEHPELIVAVVKDVVRGKFVTFEAIQSFDTLKNFWLLTPSEKKIECSRWEFKNLDHKDIQEIKSGDLFIMPWQKAMVVKTILVKIDS